MQVTATNWWVIKHGPLPAAMNMAMDEAMLEHAAQWGRPALRFYGWSEPAATFGYFQRYAEIAALTDLRPLVRRPTGGGLVPHDRDWTYSVVFPPGDAWYESRAVESYQRLHEWLKSAFRLMRFNTTLAPCCRPEGPGQCFVGAEKHDLLWEDQKIAGAAQRRNRLGLLIQGSVQPPQGAERAAWEAAMLETANLDFGVRCEPLKSEADFLATAAQLAADKYSQESYNAKK